MIVNPLEFVAPLAIVQALCSLTNQVLELCHIDEIIALRRDVLQYSLAFWMLQSDSVLSSSSCFPAKINHCCDLGLKASSFLHTRILGNHSDLDTG